MRRASRACRAPPPASCPGGSGVAGGGPLAPRKLQSGRGAPGRLPVLFLLVFGVSLCKGAPVAPSILQEEKDLQLWNEIDDVCSAYLARDTQLQSSNTLEELCFMVLGLLQKTQGLDEKDHSKRVTQTFCRLSCILCCNLFPSCMRRGRRGTKWTKNFEYLEEFKVEDILSSGHAMGGDQLHFVKKDSSFFDLKLS